MSASILAKLQIKNIPVVKQKMAIVMPGQGPKAAGPKVPGPKVVEDEVEVEAEVEDIATAGPGPAKPARQIKTTINDKTQLVNFDRQAFLKQLAATKVVEPRGMILSPEVVLPTPTMQGPVPVSAPAPAKTKPRLKIVSTLPAAVIEPIVVEPIVVEPAGPASAVAGPAVAGPAVAGPASIIIRKPVKRKPVVGVIQTGPASMVKIGEADIRARILPKEPSVIISASSYYMNNREIFTNFMSSLFGKYKQDLLVDAKGATCDIDPNAPFSLMTHQKIVRDYLNLYTPYRGLLLFHGLGSGKTCSSIAIAEGMKSGKKIIVMTPKSLQMNFKEELKKCGDELYHKNQYWEFIDTTVEPELVETLSSVLSLSVEFIRKAGGAWLVNMQKKSNFDALDSTQKNSLNAQLNEMISYKYKFISYNGMRKTHLAALTNDGKINPFDNAVVIIDEAHNFVSRIVNKLTKKDTLSGAMYEYLMDAQNVKIVLLSGTPIINYPNEIAILFNILRGKIKTWTLKLAISSEARVSQEYFRSIFKSTLIGGNILDYLEYKPTSTMLVITRNPFGFVNKTKNELYDGVRVGDRGDLDDDAFLQLITKILLKNGIKIMLGGVKVESFKALPDKMDDFKAYFIADSSKEVKNMNLFKRRILGLTSYFRSAQESLMPKYLKSRDFHIVKIPMSDFQFGIYEEARVEERKLEKNNAKKRGKKSKTGEEEESASTYRIFSRAFCNFVFPRPDIRRPMPREGDLMAAVSAGLDEDDFDALTDEEKLENVDGRYEADELADGAADADAAAGTNKARDKALYEKKIVEVLSKLSAQKDKYLTPEALKTYSPKFLNILENVKNIDHEGLHLIYSQFRTLEGIGILKLIFEANGFVQFKIKKMGEVWQLNMSEEEVANPNKFALYTGTETAEEKEVIRNIFNGDWKYVSLPIETKLKAMAINNMYGEIIKVLMISASGAEGISLKNVRYVHITEPYWHPVRTEQVIGRARRICSHKDLPEALRTVEVFLYLMTFTATQVNSDQAIELRQDKSKVDGETPVSSDEALYEIATIKENINLNILQAVKEASIDCALHSKVGSTEPLKCFTFGSVNVNNFTYSPSIAAEELDVDAAKNQDVVKWKGVEFTHEGITYALNRATGDLYDLESYKLKQPVQVGKLIMGTGPKAQYTIEKI
jgi:hypothetical protein